MGAENGKWCPLYKWNNFHSLFTKLADCLFFLQHPWQCSASKECLLSRSNIQIELPNVGTLYGDLGGLGANEVINNAMGAENGKMLNSFHKSLQYLLQF